MHWHFLRIALTSVGVLLFVTQFVYAAVTIHGIVRDPLGAAVRDAEVVIATPERAPLATARTDAEGRFQLDAPVPGAYLLIVKSPGFAEATSM